MRLLLALAALCAGVSATSQDSEAREVARVAADAIAHTNWPPRAACVPVQGRRLHDSQLRLEDLCGLSYEDPTQFVKTYLAGYKGFCKAI